MSKRVHVVKKHQEFGDVEAFNWKSEEFCNTLGSLGCEMCHEEEDYDDFECEMDEYLRALELVKAYKEKGNCQEVADMFDEADAYIDTFESCLEDLGDDKPLSANALYKHMKKFYDECEQGYGWISFSAW